ncbi:MAG: TonB family protein [Methyloprofundus sp.]|nr:TonB family protein [Methyloprofundus sp.]
MRLLKAKDNTLFSMLGIAIILHVFIILAITFQAPDTNKAGRSLEITLVTNAAKKAPKKAEFLAQNNQIGAGEQKVKPKPAMLKVASSGKQQNKPAQKKAAQQKLASQKQVLTQKKSNIKVSASKKEDKKREKVIPKLSMASLQEQVAQLGATIRYQQPSSEKNRIKFVNSVSAHKYLASQYISDWQRKIESMGNLNYPNIAKRAGFTQSLIMDVGIKPDGTIYSLRIRKSSGYPALDKAAKRIVRLSEPFPALPKDLLQELDILVITRVWKFTDKTGL